MVWCSSTIHDFSRSLKTICKSSYFDLLLMFFMKITKFIFFLNRFLKHMNIFYCFSFFPCLYLKHGSFGWVALHFRLTFSMSIVHFFKTHSLFVGWSVPFMCTCFLHKLWTIVMSTYCLLFLFSIRTWFGVSCEEVSCCRTIVFIFWQFLFNMQCASFWFNVICKSFKLHLFQISFRSLFPFCTILANIVQLPSLSPSN